MPSPTDNLNEYFFTCFTEHYEFLGDDESDREVKELMRTIAASWEDHAIERWIRDSMDDFETISKNLMKAMIGSIDFEQLKKDLHDWLRDIMLDEAEEEEASPSDSIPCLGHSIATNSKISQS